MHRDEPHRLVAARMGPPLVIGIGQGERFVASDIPALLAHTRDFVFLEDGDVATVCADDVRLTNARGRRRRAHPRSASRGTPCRRRRAATATSC